ncbi:hypothetical protein BD408DRAFT_445195 [Parasitella parasitica]|nr:hypothetical protein BD408DRAFT_445195 [Parasitella parasitica]
MNLQEKEPLPIDNQLYQFNVLYQSRLVELNRSQLYKNDEKEKIISLLTYCRSVDGSKIFEPSVQSPRQVDKASIAGITHIAFNGDTNTNNITKIVKPAKPNSRQEGSHDAGVRKVIVNIIQPRKSKQCKDKSLYKKVLKKEHRKRKRLSSAPKKRAKGKAAKQPAIMK